MKYLILVVGLAVSAQAQSIELRKTRTLTDRDGKGFTRAPLVIAPIRNGGFALNEMNELPMVVDSTGRLIKRFGRGQGPGEFRFNANGFRIGRGDTVYAGNGHSLHVFAPDMSFVRTIRISGISHIRDFLPFGDTLVVTGPKPGDKSTMKSVHVSDSKGAVLRSFLTDSIVNRPPSPIRAQSPMRPEYRIGKGGANAIWIIPRWEHRLEKWTLAGKRALVIATQPSWFPVGVTFSDPQGWITAAHEVDGVLWVLSGIPVPNARELSMAALGKAKVKEGTESDARRIPFESLATSYLEVFDATTGKLLGDKAIKAYGVAILDDRHVMLYNTGPNGEAQLEIWEMKLKR